MSATRRPGRITAWLWAAVILEWLLPLPGPLSLGAAYVLLFRPAWFLDWVQRFYARVS